MAKTEGESPRRTGVIQVSFVTCVDRSKLLKLAGAFKTLVRIDEHLEECGIRWQLVPEAKEELEVHQWTDILEWHQQHIIEMLMDTGIPQQIIDIAEDKA